MPRMNFYTFLEIRNFDHKIDFWALGLLYMLKNAIGAVIQLDMQNGIHQKLDLVIIFASLAWFDQNSKSERQVRFAAPFRGRQTAYRPVNASPPCASLPKTFYVSYLLQCWNFRKFAAQLFLLHNFVCASNLMCF